VAVFVCFYLFYILFFAFARIEIQFVKKKNTNVTQKPKVLGCSSLVLHARNLPQYVYGEKKWAGKNHGHPNRVIRSAARTTQRCVTGRNAHDISPLTIWLAKILGKTGKTRELRLPRE
jgi:hypothetical protein